LAAGRFLRPEQYGKVHLAVSISDVLVLLATLGIPPTLIKHLAQTSDPAEQGRIAAAAFGLFGVLLAALWTIFGAAGASAAALLRLDGEDRKSVV
jgi:O-antigen/teichoic acid export membrane protein